MILGKKSQKYSLLILFIALFSAFYSFLFSTILGGFFNAWELIHVVGPAGLLGYGMLLIIHSKEFRISIRNPTPNEDILYRKLNIAAAAGIILGAYGIWWFIIIIFYFPRFFYWPLFWIITFLCSVCSVGAGIFSLLIVTRLKNLIPIIILQQNNTLFPVTQYILINKFPGLLLICLSVLCIVYQTGLFPFLGF